MNLYSKHIMYKIIQLLMFKYDIFFFFRVWSHWKRKPCFSFQLQDTRQVFLFLFGLVSFKNLIFILDWNSFLLLYLTGKCHHLFTHLWVELFINWKQSSINQWSWKNKLKPTLYLCPKLTWIHRDSWWEIETFKVNHFQREKMV